MKATLMKHQQEGVTFAQENNGVAAFHYEVGTGKTITALATFESFREKEPDLKLLVICPISLIHGAWAKEIEKFTDYKWCDLHGQNRGEKGYEEVADIYIINFEYLISIQKFSAITRFISENKFKFMVVIDEASKMKNHASVTVDRLNGTFEKGKYIQGIKDLCKYRIELTGTPAPNDYHEYWAQMYFLHPSILGNNFYKFRNTYYSMQRGKEIIKGAVYNKATLREMFGQGYKYQFDESKKEEFFNKLKPWCHVVKAKDCIDLPEFVDEYRMIEMTPDQNKVYKQMKNEFVAEIKNIINEGKLSLEKYPISEIYKDGIEPKLIIANIVLTKMMKLRQITSGFAIDEQGIAHAVTTKTNPKLMALLDIIEECGDTQMIIWCQFRWEIALIKNALQEIGGISELHGGIQEKNRIDHVDKFLCGTNRFLIAHPDSAAHGLTFINSHISVYFSLSYSFEEYSQSRGRIMRHGQKTNCIYFHILATGTVDEDILAVCQKKQTKQDIAERFLK